MPTKCAHCQQPVDSQVATSVSHGSRQSAPIDHERGPGHEGRRIARQKQGCIGDLLGLTDSTQRASRRLCQEGLVGFTYLLSLVTQHTGVSITGTDAVDANVLV